MAHPFWLAKMLVRTGVARWLPSVRRLLEGGTSSLHHCSNRLLAAPIDELISAARSLEVQGPEVIDLALGAPRFDIVPSATTKLPADRRGWPPPAGIAELRATVAEQLLTHRSIEVSAADEVLITCGATGAFAAACDAFLDPGDGVVLLDPTSPLFHWTLRARRARVRWLPTWMENGWTRFHLDRLARVLRGARLMVLCSPGNPTGGLITADDLEQIAWWADRRDVLIYADEVFSQYCYAGESPSIGSLPRARRRTLTASSVSKSHALASARVGWLAASRSLVRPCLVSAALHTPFVATLCQQIACAALRQPDDHFSSILSDFEKRRRYTFERLRGIDIKPEWSDGAFFFWLPVWPLNLTGRQFAEQLLQTMRVQVTPGEVFGPSGQGYVRLSYAVEDGRLREGLNRLASFIQGLSEQSLDTKRAA